MSVNKRKAGDYLKILFLGDIVGRPGRETVQSFLPKMKEDQKIDMVIANGENIAGGFGITPALMYELFSAGIDVFTSGNHIWNKKEIFDVISSEEEAFKAGKLSSRCSRQGGGNIPIRQFPGRRHKLARPGIYFFTL
jgi:calcineurin-like phosphoesterase